MDIKVTRRRLIYAGLALPLLAGCGGSGTGPAGLGGNGSDPTRGSLALKLNFPPSRAVKTAVKSRETPEPTGFIPVGTRSVRVSVADTTTGAAVAPAQLITAPLSRPGPIPTVVPVQFTGLPVGPVTVTAVAYPDAAGEQTPLATGTASGQIVANTLTSLQVLVELTLARLFLNRESVLVATSVTAQNHAVSVMASVLDESDRSLALPIYWLSQDPGIAQVTFDQNSPTTATITGVSFGTTVVTVVEPNSGMTTTLSVNSDFEP